MLRQAFTLIELLLVIAVIGFLSSIVLASLADVREKARIATALQFDKTIYSSLGDALQGEWLFNESSGTPYDMSGLGNDGSLSGETTRVDGINGGNAVSLDGNADYVSLPTGGSMQIGLKDFTITMWVYVDPAETRGGLFTATGPDNAVRLYYDNNGTVVLGIFDGTYAYAGSMSTLPIAQWTHLAVSVDRDGTADFYINGRFDNDASVAAKSSAMLTTANATRIGYDAWLSADVPVRSFQGQIDDVRFYHRKIDR